MELRASRLSSSSTSSAISSIRSVRAWPVWTSDTRSVEAPDGNYVCDVTARFEATGVEFLVLIEAKLHGRPVERQHVQVLQQKVTSANAHKGILVSSARFQSGAIDFAKAHRIALLRRNPRGSDSRYFRLSAASPAPT
jgi:hypothetical protein